MTRQVHIAFAVDNGYTDYLAVALTSLTNCVNKSTEYIVYILNTGLERENMLTFEQTVSASRNISLVFVPVNAYFDGITLYTRSGEEEYLSAATYYRLCLHNVLPSCNKILYLDCDIVFCEDPAEIYNVNISDKMIAGVPDITGNWICKLHDSQLRKYRENIGITCLDEYVNAGVLLINLDKLRKDYPDDRLIQLATSRKWEKHDQDIINVISDGKKIVLPYRWNLIEFIDEKYKDVLELSAIKEYEEGRANPGIIHYASRKPWRELGVLDGDIFWKNAACCESFDRIMSTLMREYMSNTELLSTILFEKAERGNLSNKTLIKSLLVNLMSRVKGNSR